MGVGPGDLISMMSQHTHALARSCQPAPGAPPRHRWSRVPCARPCVMFACCLGVRSMLLRCAPCA
eukprot:15483743-Alexandrium_andersonii.AAC.1